MRVNVHLHPFIIDDEIPSDSLSIEGDTVGKCIENLIKRFPALREKLFTKPGQLHAYLEVYVNDESVYPNELNKPVKEGDEISITYLLAGG